MSPTAPSLTQSSGSGWQRLVGGGHVVGERGKRYAGWCLYNTVKVISCHCLMCVCLLCDVCVMCDVCVLCIVCCVLYVTCCVMCVRVV